MEKFEKCTVAMLGGPCSQHVTGNTSRLNQSQSAIISTMPNAGYVVYYSLTITSTFINNYEFVD